MTYVDTLGQQAKVASRQIAKLSTAAKNDLLNQVVLLELFYQNDPV